MTRMNTTILVMLIQTMGQNILDSDEDEHNNLGHAHTEKGQNILDSDEDEHNNLGHAHTNNGAEYSRQ